MIAAPHAPGAFSLVELVGALAILVILGTLIIPRVIQPGSVTQTVQGVSKARIAQAVAELQAIKSAAAQHRANAGSLARAKGAALPVQSSYTKYDSVLISEQLLERPFRVKIGDGGSLRLVDVSGLPASAPIDGTRGAYDLRGNGANAITGASYVLEAVISGLSEAEARALNDEVDGPSLGAQPGQDDRKGKVIYRLAPAGTPTVVHVYITHE